MSDYEEAGMEDGMTATELAEYDRTTEYRLDAEQEAADAERAAQDAAAEAPEDPDECAAEFIDGTWHGCGACLACRNTQDEDEELYRDHDENTEWNAEYA